MNGLAGATEGCDDGHSPGSSGPRSEHDGQGLLLVVGGIGLGLVASTALGRLITGLLYGVNVNDPLTLLAVAAALIVVASLACTVPAWRAVRIDPTTALKSD